MDTSRQIPEYVFASLNDTANEQETHLTNEWLRHGENELLYSKLDQLNRLSSDLHKFQKFSLAEGQRELKRKLQKSQRKVVLLKLQRIAAVVMLPLLLASTWFYFQNTKLRNEIASNFTMQEIKTQPGLRSHLFLADGTEVWLNTGSTLNFPSVFTEDTRTVELEGEAYFRVAKNKEKPFIVKSENISVTALGTEFNVCAFNGDELISTSLVEGKVLIKNHSNKNQEVVLAPDEQLIYEKESAHFIKKQVNAEEVSAWKDGKLIFNDTPLAEVAGKLNHWFNANISIEDPAIRKYEYTATFTNENLSQVVELLSLSAPIRILVNEAPVVDFRIKPGDKIRIERK